MSVLSSTIGSEWAMTESCWSEGSTKSCACNADVTVVVGSNPA